MGLKAKLEAVIYAAEEPVTLAQLAALFAEDALEWKTQKEAAAAAEQAELGLSEELAELDPDTVLEELAAEAVLAEIELEVDAAAQTEEPAAQTEGGQGGTGASRQSESPPAATELVEPDDGAAPLAESGADLDLEARRQVRLRDREARAVIRQLLDELIASSASDGRGIEIREIAGGFRMATKPEYHDVVRSFVKSLKPPLKLSLPALETLAVIAYKQPVTAPEVNEIRGVDSSAVFGSLLARKLIATAGRKPVIGRPILYKTTREFLLRFGLKDVTELPSMEEFEKMAAIELEEPEIASQTDSATAPTPKPDLNPELEFDRNGGEPPIENNDPGTVLESFEMPAVTAVSSNRAN